MAPVVSAGLPTSRPDVAAFVMKPVFTVISLSVTTKVGPSPGAFYRYFPSKDDIVLEISGQAFAMIFASTGTALGCSQGDRALDATIRSTRSWDTTPTRSPSVATPAVQYRLGSGTLPAWAEAT